MLACSTGRRRSRALRSRGGGSVFSGETPALALPPQRHQIDSEELGSLLEGGGLSEHPLHVRSLDVLERPLVAVDVPSVVRRALRTTPTRHRRPLRCSFRSAAREPKTFISTRGEQRRCRAYSRWSLIPTKDGGQFRNIVENGGCPEGVERPRAAVRAHGTGVARTAGRRSGQLIAFDAATFPRRRYP